MILTAHQPVYLPWLGLFHKIALADKFISFDQVQYLPKDWNNRNKIKTPSGEIWLSVPVYKKGYMDKKICEIEIDNTKDWKNKHWHSIRANYAKSKYFKMYADFFEDVYLNKDWNYLDELNIYMLKWFLKVLNINTPVESAGDYDFNGKKNDLVVDMCKKLGAKKYIFGALGKDYAVLEDFEKNSISVYFQEYHHPVYPQRFGGFLPYMSIIDLLFNCGDSSYEILMSNNIHSI